jgi:hypothetical protein
MGLAPSANGENPGKTAVAKVPVPIFSQPLRVPSNKLIGVGKTGCPVSPPSEPHVRFSRIRLSGWWFTAERID